jgi:hypothetical protein
MKVHSDRTTINDLRTAPQGAPPAWGRRIGTAVVLAVVAKASGLFGVHSRSTRTTAKGYTLTVTYPQTARAGLDVPWRARVHHPGGLPDPGCVGRLLPREGSLVRTQYRPPTRAGLRISSVRHTWALGTALGDLSILRDGRIAGLL